MTLNFRGAVNCLLFVEKNAIVSMFSKIAIPVYYRLELQTMMVNIVKDLSLVPSKCFCSIWRVYWTVLLLTSVCTFHIVLVQGRCFDVGCQFIKGF